MKKSIWQYLWRSKGLCRSPECMWMGSTNSDIYFSKRSKHDKMLSSFFRSTAKTYKYTQNDGWKGKLYKLGNRNNVCMWMGSTENCLYFSRRVSNNKRSFFIDRPSKLKATHKMKDGKSSFTILVTGLMCVYMYVCMVANCDRSN